jgi:hypothetical protein
MTLEPKKNLSVPANAIDLNDVAQVEHWCKQLDCSPIELRNSVFEKGRLFVDVAASVIAHRLPAL